MSDARVSRTAPTVDSPRAIVRRAEVIIAWATSKGVALPEVVQAKETLGQALSTRMVRRTARNEASRAQDLARDAWDDASRVVRAAIEGHLCAQHLSGAKLRARLAVYFPRVVTHRSSEESGTPVAPKPEAPKPEAPIK